jgi:lipopolysaccharide export system protein LptA
MRVLLRTRKPPPAAWVLAVSIAAVALFSTRETARADPLIGIGGEALDLTASRLEVDVHGGTAILTGNVSLVKGELRVSCPRIDIRYDDAPRVTWAKGSGGVTADIRGVHAEAPEVELDLAHHVLELRGGVHLSRGQGWLNAESATIETSTGKVTLKEVRGSVPVGLPKP